MPCAACPFERSVFVSLMTISRPILTYCLWLVCSDSKFCHNHRTPSHVNFSSSGQHSTRILRLLGGSPDSISSIETKETRLGLHPAQVKSSSQTLKPKPLSLIMSSVHATLPLLRRYFNVSAPNQSTRLKTNIQYLFQIF